METTGYGCEVLFDIDRAATLQHTIEGATGELCPCKQGKVCPLLPQKLLGVQVSPARVIPAA